MSFSDLLGTAKPKNPDTAQQDPKYVKDPLTGHNLTDELNLPMQTIPQTLLDNHPEWRQKLKNVVWHLPGPKLDIPFSLRAGIPPLTVIQALSGADLKLGEFLSNMWDEDPVIKKIRDKIEANQIITPDEKAILAKAKSEEVMGLVIAMSGGLKTSGEERLMPKVKIGDGPIVDAVIPGVDNALASGERAIVKLGENVTTGIEQARPGVVAKIEALKPVAENKLLPISNMIKKLTGELPQGTLPSPTVSGTTPPTALVSKTEVVTPSVPVGEPSTGIMAPQEKWAEYNKILDQGQDIINTKNPVWEKSRDKIILDQVIAGYKRVGYPDSNLFIDKFINEAKNAGLVIEDFNGKPIVATNKNDITAYKNLPKIDGTQAEYDLIGFDAKKQFDIQGAQALYDDLKTEAMSTQNTDELASLTDEIQKLRDEVSAQGHQLVDHENDWKALLEGEAKRGDITKLEKELDATIGYTSSGSHWKLEYHQRNLFLDAVKSDPFVPKEIVSKIDAIQSRLADIRSAKASTYKSLQEVLSDTNLTNEQKNIEIKKLYAKQNEIVTKKVKEIKEMPIDQQYVDAAKGRIQTMIDQSITDEQFKRQDIAREFADKLDTIVHERPVEVPKGAIGVYHLKSQDIAVMGRGDISTVAHEIGHHIENMIEGGIYRGTKDANVRSAAFAGQLDLNAYRTELLPIATTPAGGKNAKVGAKLSEGLAEFISKYVTNPKEALDVAPRFFKKFETYLTENNPDMLAAIQKAQSDYAKWEAMPAARKVLSQIDQNGKAAPRPTIREMFDNFYTAGINAFHPVEQLERQAVGAKTFEDIRQMVLDKKILPSEVPSLWYRRYKGSSGIATHKWIEGQLLPIYSSVKDIADDFRVYLMSKRVLSRSDVTFGISPDDAQQALTDLSQNPAAMARLEVAGQRYQEYTRALLQYLKDAGVLSEEGLKNITDKNQWYAPAKRVMDDVEAFTGMSTKTVSMKGSPISKLKGSQREIIDPLEQTIADTYRIIEAAERNRVARAIAKLPQLADRMVENPEKRDVFRDVKKVPKKQVPVAKISVAEVAQELGIPLESLPEDVQQATKTIFRMMRTAPEKGLLGVFENGEMNFYRLPPIVAQAVSGVNEEAISTIAKISQPFTQLLRTTATGVNPEFFLIRNPVRDQITAGFQSRYGYVPFYDGAKVALNMVFGKDKYNYWYDKFINDGGSFSYFVTQGRESVRAQLGQALPKEVGLKEKIVNVIMTPVQFLEKMSTITENMTRVGLKTRAEQKIQKLGIDDPFGLMSNLEARQGTTDFGRKGTKMANLNMIYAYLNARVQGLDNVARNFRENPKTAIPYATLFGLGLPISLYLWNRQFPTYEKVKEYEKDNYYVFMWDDNPEHALHIPKTDWIKMTAIPLENAMMWLDNKNPAAVGDVARRWFEQITPMQPSELGGTAVKPLLEQMSNYNFFYGKALIPDSLKDLPPEQQYNANTSLAAKTLGQLMKDITGTGWSPLIIDNYIQSYLAGTGKIAVSIGDFLFKRDPDYLNLQKGRVRIPIVSSFLGVNVENPYDVADKLQSDRNAILNEIVNGDLNKAEKMMLESGYSPTTAEVKSAVKSEMIRSIRRNEIDKAMKLGKEFSVGLSQKEVEAAIDPAARILQSLPKSIRGAFIEEQTQP